MSLRAIRAPLPVLLSLVAIAVAGCGSSSSNSSSGQQARRGPFGDPKVQACLKQQGVSLPNFRGRPGGQRPGAPSTGTNGSPPPTGTTGAPPPGARRGGFPGGGNPAQFAKLRAALQKCGAQFPQPGQGGAPAGTPGQ